MLRLAGGDINKVNGITAFNAMREGDEYGKSVVDKYISYLACGITNVINVFQPDDSLHRWLVSAERAKLSLLHFVANREKERYTKHNKKQTKLCAATLGNDAGIIGAAFLD